VRHSPLSLIPFHPPPLLIPHRSIIPTSSEYSFQVFYTDDYLSTKPGAEAYFGGRAIVIADKSGKGLNCGLFPGTPTKESGTSSSSGASPTSSGSGSASMTSASAAATSTAAASRMVGAASGAAFVAAAMVALVV
jgi:hypothetical protein